MKFQLDSVFKRKRMSPTHLIQLYDSGDLENVIKISQHDNFIKIIHHWISKTRLSYTQA